MSYDFHGPWNSTLGHSSPLHPRSDQTGDDQYRNLVSTKDDQVYKHCKYMYKDDQYRNLVRTGDSQYENLIRTVHSGLHKFNGLEFHLSFSSLSFVCIFRLYIYIYIFDAVHKEHWDLQNLHEHLTTL